MNSAKLRKVMMGVFFGSVLLLVIASYLLKDTPREGGFVNSRPDGFTAPEWTEEQYPNGAKRAEGHLKGNKKHGRWTYFTSTGDTLMIERYEEGILIDKRGFNN